MSCGRSKVCVVLVGVVAFSWARTVDLVRGEEGFSVGVAGVSDRLEAAVSVGDRRQPARQLLSEIAEQVSLPLLIDPGVGAGVLAEGLELELRHSRARDALGWIMDLTGVRVYLVDRALVVRGGDDGPAMLEAIGGLWWRDGASADRQEQQPRERALSDRVARVDLVDASLHGAASALRASFRVDVVCSRQWP